MRQKKPTRPWFPGLKLKQEDRELLRRKARERLTERTWKRIRALQMLDEGYSLAATAAAIGSAVPSVRRVGERYLASGVEVALKDAKRPLRPRRLDTRQEAAIIAMVCGPAPEGRARWTIMLIVEESIKRGIVDEVGRETIRVLLKNHELKPWREKNVVRPTTGRALRGAHGRRTRHARATAGRGRASRRTR
ncbi:helix-turn-helix domain-containing protein [Nannocystis sp. SCPEA4]|uniref:helix-turn-helix domain-containing protein n=1 Tax=Nannocystis sp. SCPEA4 TaxID=2996787 RepID=UPI00226FB5B9|nr:helix-turn-helix domain-containing protein [Nannocystis sp. SCPEA4]MCY1053541.1 helix-turn-helix domain-containing protein [Nannocystis sp. SCPEA4]MCY1058198.1 helix-turn-helix domain-containing protein [Nannocystis sp. SCPEA4]MCY1058261.1 helix-turn-helix domain-containing protein [Nannocystis sp. SCPEA4]MCY1059873.1 helix-turn-helix domain-containing protein [Nannocystis sp. SCPEA4]MCY1063025.1 helix-turn-helix domain-containing protein [Nannocystis sp. SCPEA4]